MSMEEAAQLEITALPEEMIIKIFSFLSLIDKKSARLVNKLWHRLSYATSLVRNDITPIYNNYDLFRKASPQSQHINIRVFMDEMDLEALSVFMDQRSFWREHCQNLRSVEVFFRGDIFWCLLQMFISCPTIEHISVYAVCRDGIYPLPDIGLNTADIGLIFPNLRVLSVLGNDYASLPAIKLVLRSAPKLERVFLNCSMSYPVSPVHELSTLDFRQAQSLKEINLTGTALKDAFIASVTDVLGPKLERLTIDNSYNCSLHMSLDFTTKKCGNLQQLLLRNVPLKHNSITNFSSLTVLSLFNIQNLTDDMVASVAHFQNLTNFDMSFNPELSNRAFSEAFCKMVRPMMVELRLHGCNLLDECDLIKDIAPNLPNLRTLYVESCCISATSLLALVKYNRALQCVTLLGKFKGTLNVTLLPTIVMNNLVHLDVRYTDLPWPILATLKCPALKMLIWDDGDCHRIKERDSIKEVFSCSYIRNHFLATFHMMTKRLLPCCKSAFVKSFVVYKQDIYCSTTA